MEVKKFISGNNIPMYRIEKFNWEILIENEIIRCVSLYVKTFALTRFLYDVNKKILTIDEIPFSCEINEIENFVEKHINATKSEMMPLYINEPEYFECVNLPLEEEPEFVL